MLTRPIHSIKLVFCVFWNLVRSFIIHGLLRLTISCNLVIPCFVHNCFRAIFINDCFVNNMTGSIFIYYHFYDHIRDTFSDSPISFISDINSSMTSLSDSYNQTFRFYYEICLGKFWCFTCMFIYFKI